MAEKLLKEIQVKTVQAEVGERLLGDGGGLYLRVRPNGDKAWLFISQVAGKRCKHGLGPYPEVSLANAREKAAEARRILATGVDPATAKRIEKEDRRAKAATALSRMTVAGLFELWHGREVSKRKDGGAEIRRIFEKDVLPRIGTLPAELASRRDILTVLDVVKERGAKRLANILLQSLRQMFRFGALREIVASDPTFGLNKTNVGGREAVRDRFLAEDEIKELGRNLPNANLLKTSEAALWLMLATAARVGEVSKARWSDFDLKEQAWTIPEETSKNGRPHVIHLSKFAIKQISVLQEQKQSDAWVFPNRHGSDHIDPKALQKQFHDRQRSQRLRGRSRSTGALALSGGEWRAHDLRRTAATLMGEAGVRSDVIERCLNHVGDNKLVTTYQRQQLIAERIDAFRILGKRLERLLRDAEKSGGSGKAGN